MKVLSTTRILPPLVAAAVLGAVYAVAAFARPIAVGGSGQPPARSVPVTTVVRGCPALGGAGAAGIAFIAAAPGSKGGGQAQIIRLGGARDAPVATVTQPGQLSVTRVRAARAAAGGGSTSSSPKPKPSQSASASSGGPPVATRPARGGVIVRADEGMARGVEVEQVSGSSATVMRCESPGTQFWFVGPGVRGAGRLQLFLMNPGNQPADVNVGISTDAGPLQGPADSGIPLAPHSMVVQSLGRALHSASVTALHVSTSVGQVVAFVQVISGSGRTGAWLPPAQEPAKQVVVPGLPRTAGTRELYVAVPGAQDAHLSVRAITTRGTYEPVGGGSLDIPAGSAVSIPLPSLASIPASLKLSANVPVTATAMLPGGPTGAPGVFTAAAPPLVQQGVVAFDQSGAGTSTELVLSAPGRAASARVWRGASAAAGTSSLVHIPSGKTVLVPLHHLHGAAHGAPYAVVITPLRGSGPLYAGRVLESSGGSALQSIIPVESGLTAVPLPPVRQAFITTGP